MTSHHAYLIIQYVQAGLPRTRFQFVEGEGSNIHIMPEVVRWGLSHGYTITINRGVKPARQSDEEINRAEIVMNEVLSMVDVHKRLAQQLEKLA